MAKTWSRYSSPRALLLVSNQRALTAALKLQLCMGSGKSWRIQGNLVLGRGLLEQRVGAAAVRALHVFKLDNGHARAGGRLEGGGVMHLSSGRRRDKLGAGPGGGDKQRDDGKAQRKAGPPAKSGEAMGKSEKTRHGDWTTPSR